MLKEVRQGLLLEIIGTSSVGSQQQIVRLLKTKGYAVTQASISRDLEDLGISKESGVYRQRPVVPRRTTFGIVSFEPAGGNLIVAKCGSGLASAFAVRLDALHLHGIVGTVAGDDTVFVAVTDSKSQKSIIRRLREQFSE